MTRTFHPKVNHYQSDGTGRDHFITLTNGGLTTGRIASFTDSSFVFKRDPHHYASPSPRKDPPAFEYFSDGTGRDSYIKAGSGGLKKDYRGLSGEKFFKDTLRQHELLPYKRIKNKFEKDITDYLFWTSPRGRLEQERKVKI